MTVRLHYEANDAASRSLAAADPAMARLIAAAGSVEFDLGDNDPFDVLIDAIVGQQLSGKAAASIYRRLSECVGVAPGKLAAASDAELTAVGLSRRKAEYVRGVADAVVGGELDLDGLRHASDDDVVAELTRLRGVGRWTAHMFLIFALDRPDVLPVDDAGVRASVGRLLGLGRAATLPELEAAGERWKPHRSAASLYLWRSSELDIDG